MASTSSTSDDLPFWVEACRTLAPAAAWVVFLSPFSTIRGVARSKSVGGLPALPYSTMVLNCSLWILYGLLTNEPTVMSANTVGLALGAYYFHVFYSNCSPTATGLPGTLKDHVQVLTLTVTLALLIVIVLPRDTAAELIGKAAVIFCVILFASPLSVLKQAISSHSAKDIPLPFALASTVNTLLWSVSGVIALKDSNIYIPNLLGLACSLAQLVVIFMYGSGEKRAAPSDMELPLTR